MSFLPDHPLAPASSKLDRHFIRKDHPSPILVNVLLSPEKSLACLVGTNEGFAARYEGIIAVLSGETANCRGAEIMLNRNLVLGTARPAFDVLHDASTVSRGELGRSASPCFIVVMSSGFEPGNNVNDVPNSLAIVFDFSWAHCQYIKRVHPCSYGGSGCKRRCARHFSFCRGM